MVHRILVVGAVLLAFGVVSCLSNPKGDSRNKDTASLAGGGDFAAVDETVSINKSGERAGLGGGTMSIFGIKIPTGMLPTQGPEKVYRFEGRLPVERTTTLVRNQIVAEKEEKENKGVLFRFAKSKNTRGGASKRDASRALAVRVFPTDTGSALDIWLEREYAQQLPDIRDASHESAFPKLQGVVRGKTDKASREKEMQSRTTIMRALGKIERGEPLTPEEIASGVMD